MRETSLVICFIINIFICFGIPIVALIYLIVAEKKAVKSFFVGVAIFLIFQVFTRIPILQHVLPKMDWYIIMTTIHPIIYGLFLGVTAGLFEEIGRFLGFKIGLKKNRRWIDGFAFGMGHGGIEAIILAGSASINNLSILISLNNGSFDASKIGMSEEKVRALFATTTNLMVLVSGLERIFAITIQIGLTLVVLYGIKKRKLIYLGLAILSHAIIDSPLGIFSQVFGMRTTGIETWVGITALISFIFIIKSKKLFEKLEGVN